MLILRDKTLDEVSAQMQAWRPNMLFFSSGALPKNTEGRRTLMEFTLKDDQGRNCCNIERHFVGQTCALCLQAKRFLSGCQADVYFPCCAGGDVPVNPDMLASLCEGQEIDAVYIQAFATARHGAETMLSQCPNEAIYHCKNKTKSGRTMRH